MNKTIYMTYKKNIPDKVKNRWLKYNPDYKIDFSLDKKCLNFLKNNFNENISNLFNEIDKGMFKADLWRICKLYSDSGVYADVDLIPYLNIDKLNNDIDFYSSISLNKGHIFQAFIVNFSKPKNPLFLVFIISFLINRPDNKLMAILKNHPGPCYDMYKCITYMLNVKTLLPEKIYKTDIVKLKINIGESDYNIKKINLYYFPDNIDYSIKLHKTHYKDNFNFVIKDNYLIVTRIDKKTGWGHNHNIDICFPHKVKFCFFSEESGLGDISKLNSICGYDKSEMANAKVMYKNKKILDSRDREYHKNKGW